MAHSTFVPSTRASARPGDSRANPVGRPAIKRPILVLVTLVIVLLAVGGWVVHAFKTLA
jgi:hypothetical protein